MLMRLFPAVIHLPQVLADIIRLLVVYSVFMEYYVFYVFRSREWALPGSERMSRVSFFILNWLSLLRILIGRRSRSLLSTLIVKKFFIKILDHGRIQY